MAAPGEREDRLLWVMRLVFVPAGRVGWVSGRMRAEVHVPAHQTPTSLFPVLYALLSTPGRFGTGVRLYQKSPERQFSEISGGLRSRFSAERPFLGQSEKPNFLGVLNSRFLIQPQGCPETTKVRVGPYRDSVPRARACSAS